MELFIVGFTWCVSEDLSHCHSSDYCGNVTKDVMEKFSGVDPTYHVKSNQSNICACADRSEDAVVKQRKY